MPNSFSKKLEQAFASHGQLCVGVDPHEELLLQSGFGNNPRGLHDFAFGMLDELVGIVSIIKPQVSFFERFGPDGFEVLQDFLSEANKRGFLVIADAKRGDIGSTMQAYADAWLSKDAPFICDALTVNPYLGVRSLLPAVIAAAERGKGVFVLAATSNPEATLIQKAKIGNQTVSSEILSEISELNRISAQSSSRFGNIGAVIGGTVALSEYGIGFAGEKALHVTPILAPGFGTQGAELSRAKEIFGAKAKDVIFTISRSALQDGFTNLRAKVSADAQILARALEH